MNPKAPILLFSLMLMSSLCHGVDDPASISSNITVMGTVFCDACSSNNFSKQSYFLQGVTVRVVCSFRVNSTSKEEISITVDRTTDKFGVYRLDVPPVEGFECQQGRALQSFCRANLVGSPSLLCNVPGLSSSTEHLAIRAGEANQCIYTLNALNYRPSKKDAVVCGTAGEPPSSDSLRSALFFWSPYPPFWSPWPFYPSPWPFLSPPSFPFPIPPISIPFLTPPPPSFPWPFPPLFPAPSPPSFFPPIPSLFPPPSPPQSFFPPIPSLFPSPPPPPPPAFPFPPFGSFPPLFGPPSPPPSPPPPSLPFTLPPFPFPPYPFASSPPPPPLSLPPPPPAFSWTDPGTWFPPRPPSPPPTRP